MHPLTRRRPGGAERGLVDGDRGGGGGGLGVEGWAELRREDFVCGGSIKELVRRHGIDRNTVRRALRADAPPVYQRTSVSKLDREFARADMVPMHRAPRVRPTGASVGRPRATTFGERSGTPTSGGRAAAVSRKAIP